MTAQTNQERLQKINQMLFEMAAGNFKFQIQRSEADDELESLVVLVNIIAEEMRAAIVQKGYVTRITAFSSWFKTHSYWMTNLLCAASARVCMQILELLKRNWWECRFQNF